MKTKMIVFSVAFLIFTLNISNAQVGVLRRAINRAIDREIDTAINKKIEEDRAKAKQAETEGEQPKSGQKGGILFGGKSDIKHNDRYDFTGRIYMQMEMHDNKDVVKSDYFMYYNPNSMNAGIEFRNVDPKDEQQAIPAIFIFDNDNRVFMMMLGSTGIISQIPEDSVLVSQGAQQKGKPVEKAQVTKTGNSKVILGYKCDEYRVVDPGQEGYSNVWMTKDVKINADRRHWNKSGLPAYYGYPEFEGSMMLASETYNKNNQLEAKMETKEINENFKHSISTTGCTFVKMNFGQAGAQKRK